MPEPKKKRDIPREPSTSMTPMQEAFITEYISRRPGPGRGRDAAIAAGYSAKTAAQQACNLLDPKKYPLVAQRIKDHLKEINDKAILSASDVLRYIHTVMTFCPADWFLPAGDEGWLVSMEDYRVLPDEIKQLIEGMETRTIERDGEITNMLRVKFVSKTVAMNLAARHQLGEKNNTTVTVHQIDWAALFGRSKLNPSEISSAIEDVTGTRAPLSLPQSSERPLDVSTGRVVVDPVEASLVDDPVEQAIRDAETEIPESKSEDKK